MQFLQFIQSWYSVFYYHSRCLFDSIPCESNDDDNTWMYGQKERTNRSQTSYRHSKLQKTILALRPTGNAQNMVVMFNAYYNFLLHRLELTAKQSRTYIHCVPSKTISQTIFMVIMVTKFMQVT